ncbi:cytochrome c heme-lyase [Fistulifera solaris]|uniref:Holocytochrome c-type synthase n=1 Tax=Fistulifera solaris TaxID=1519565 RepID=A0A1Z5K1I1_FISSO|nr:cytochrome c heme-lyase [Fistulifera solaris]|eukprot:GAX20154.1 cytochrome c heme-lyase [Fistulifera solaris]
MSAEQSDNSSRCPVKHDGGSDSGTFSFWGWLGGTNGNDSPPSEALPEGCKSPTFASLEEAARHAQSPHPDQKILLSTSRQVSSIMRGTNDDIPRHQTEDSSSNKDNKWVYPSEQQFYNAMRRKGWSNIPEDSIPTVLQIHNHINERTWRNIQEWESSDELLLARFMGRPKDISPKAFFLSKVLRMYDPPFDRHDWYVQHPGSQEQHRYVIDYYYLPNPDPNMPPIPYVDARPALDHPRAVWLQGKQFLKSAFPGITAYINKWNGQSSG